MTSGLLVSVLNMVQTQSEIHAAMLADQAVQSDNEPHVGTKES